MAAINGRWMLESSEGLIDFLRACGAAPEALEKAKNLEVPGAGGGKEEFEFNGSNMTRRVITKDDKVFTENTVTLGVETAGKSIDGRDIKVILTQDGANKFVRNETGPGYTAVWTRTIDGSKMTVVCKSGNVTCTRKYTKM